MKNSAKISVTSWVKISGNVKALRFLVDATFNDSARCEYDLDGPVRRADS